MLAVLAAQYGVRKLAFEGPALSGVQLTGVRQPQTRSLQMWASSLRSTYTRSLQMWASSLRSTRGVTFGESKAAPVPVPVPVEEGTSRQIDDCDKSYGARLSWRVGTADGLHAGGTAACIACCSESPIEAMDVNGTWRRAAFAVEGGEVVWP